MSMEILMPAVAPSMTQGSIAQWLKKEGDVVKVGDPLLEIETDKAVVTYEAPNAGVLGKILVPAGTANVQVDQVIALLLGPGEDASKVAAPSAEKAVAEAPPPAAASIAMATMTAASAARVTSASGRIAASPLARRLAAAKNLDLTQLSGSGPNGRIVKLDVESATPTQRAMVPAVAPAAGAAYDVLPHNNMRRVIAQRLTEAKQTIPHFYLTIDCEIDALLDTRKELNAWSDEAKLSVNDFIIKAVAMALKKMPDVNASWSETAILRYRHVDVSVAVSTPSGLITPIIRNADGKGLALISNEMKQLAERGREGKLQANEYQGGGFTISNLGMYGVREFSAIINPPQSCILAVGAGEERPVVKNGALGIASVMTCTLSADHRVVDGALGAEFLAVFKKLIEHPLRMLL